MENISKLQAFGTKVYSKNYMDYVEVGMQFDNGVIVITDWLSQNTLPRDRYTPTQYKDLYNTLVIEQKGAIFTVSHRAQTIHSDVEKLCSLFDCE